MEFLLLIPALILGGILFYVLQEQASDRAAYLTAVQLAIQEAGRDRAATKKLIAELTEKIQHPELPHPQPTPYQPGPPPEPDPAFEQVGKIFPDNDGVTD